MATSGLSMDINELMIKSHMTHSSPITVDIVLAIAFATASRISCSGSSDVIDTRTTRLPTSTVRLSLYNVLCHNVF